jgi:DNA-binding response OmpR family regulator
MGKRILCVDDDQDTCEMVTVLLNQAGYTVEHALSVTDGLKLAKAGRFDLILLDWLFEDGTGIELCWKIRSFNTETPILFYSGVAEQTEIDEALSAGAQGYLIKPSGVYELVDAVSNHTETEGTSDN